MLGPFLGEYPMPTPDAHVLDARGLRVGIVSSQWYPEIVRPMLEAALACYQQAGGQPADLISIEAPGTFEVPVLCAGLARRPDIHAVVALGCVIRGETTHDQHIARAVAQGLMDLSLQTGKPITLGVLTCQNRDQALARAGGAKGNKGVEAMTAAILAARTLRDSSIT